MTDRRTLPRRSRRAISKRFWKNSRTLAALTAFASRAGAAHSRCCGPACGESRTVAGEYLSHGCKSVAEAGEGPPHMWRLSVAVCALAAITSSQTAGALNASPRMSTTCDNSLNEIASNEDQLRNTHCVPTRNYDFICCGRGANVLRSGCHRRRHQRAWSRTSGKSCLAFSQIRLYQVVASISE